MKQRLCKLASAFIGVCISAQSAYAINFVTKEHLNLYITAVSEQKNVDDAVDIYQKYAEQYPNNPSVLAYYASIKITQGGEAWFPWTKLSITNEGLDMFDNALTIAQNDTTSKSIDGRISGALEAKAMASMLFMVIPDKYFQRRHEGMTLAKQIVESSEFQNKDFGVKTAFLSAYAEALFETKDYDMAKKYAQMTLDLGAQYNDAEVAKRILKEVANK